MIQTDRRVLLTASQLRTEHTLSDSDARAESDQETPIAIHILTAEVHAIDERHTKMFKLLEERTGKLYADAPAR